MPGMQSTTLNLITLTSKVSVVHACAPTLQPTTTKTTPMETGVVFHETFLFLHVHMSARVGCKGYQTRQFLLS